MLLKTRRAEELIHLVKSVVAHNSQVWVEVWWMESFDGSSKLRSTPLIAPVLHQDATLIISQPDEAEFI
ncbi:hypothetical protein TNCV_1721161 [Trichonephila clavipes]|nr:hypothetical protein TNCV_1721161 [Trichonephila clavipes]